MSDASASDLIGTSAVRSRIPTQAAEVRTRRRYTCYLMGGSNGGCITAVALRCSEQAAAIPFGNPLPSSGEALVMAFEEVRNNFVGDSLGAGLIEHALEPRGVLLPIGNRLEQ